MARSNLYLFAGGGTGGHLTPGLAVAQVLRERLAGQCRVVFVGSDRSVERDLVAANGYEHVVLPVESSQTLKRRPWRFVFRNWQALRQSRALLARERPRAVVGLGGFASVPVVWAAARARVPTLILEQNSIPGRANRFLSRRVDAVCISYPESQAAFPGARRVHFTGNPVRREIANLLATTPAENMTARSNGPPTLLILGGSQGASGINGALMHLLRDLPAALRGALFVHQTGADECDAVRDEYSRRGLRHVVEPFFNDLAEWYAAATLVISRAGATTLAELACAGCPAILLPYPHAADDHQTRNAAALEQSRAARVVRQSADPAATAKDLSQTMTSLFSEPDGLNGLRQGIRAWARPDAADRVVDVLQSLALGAMT